MKKFFACLAVLCLATLLCSCGKKEATSEQVSQPSEKKAAQTIVDKIKAAGKMTVYTNPEFPPYEYLGANKTVVGAEIDIVNRIAEKLGVKAEIVSAEFDSIIGVIQAQKADLGASGFTITEERGKLVTFSIPFVDSVQYIIIPEDSPIKVVEDLAGKKIGGQNGTTGFLICEDAINKGLLKGTGAEMKSYNTAPDAVVAMKNGRVDAVVIDELVAVSLAKKNPGYQAIPLVNREGAGLMEVEKFGMIVAKGNEALLDVVNATITEMQADGSLAEAILAHTEASSK